MASRVLRVKDRLLDLLPLMTTFAALFLFSLLPPDMSKSDVDKTRRLNVCMPADIPPLVTQNRERPGFEAELMALIAERNGWSLNIVSNSRMGTDLNPRHWHVTRARCQMLAGGISTDATTRSFLETTSPHLRTGWAFIGPNGSTLETTAGPVAFYAAIGGLNRLALGSYLKDLSLTVVIAENLDDVLSGLESGVYEGAITEALAAEQFFSETKYQISLMGPPLDSFTIGLGLWKGDQTLRLAVEDTMNLLWSNGTTASLAARYNIEGALLCPVGLQQIQQLGCFEHSDR